MRATPKKQPDYGNLFREHGDTTREYQLLPLDKLRPFAGHPFKIADDQDMTNLVESIRERGVLVPLVVRPLKGDLFEIVSGHRRHHASILAGQSAIPVIIRDLDDDEAILEMVDSNLYRESVLPSEKAFAYKMKLEAMRRQGQRTDLTSSQVGMKLNGKQSLDIMGEQTGDSRNQIHRYIRLTNLTTDLLDMVDKKGLAFNVGVEISYLNEAEQLQLMEFIERDELRISIAQAKKLKQYSQGDKLTADVMEVIVCEQKPKDRMEGKVVLEGEKFHRFFPKSTTLADKERIILQLLEKWQKEQQRKQSKER